MAAPLKYNQAYHDDWAWSLAIKGATDVEIAEAFGISVRTLNRWKKDHESFMLPRLWRCAALYIDARE